MRLPRGRDLPRPFRSSTKSLLAISTSHITLCVMLFCAQELDVEEAVAQIDERSLFAAPFPHDSSLDALIAVRHTNP